ncbi:8612_t:CDS:2, partial [Racocetra fulgida]
LSEESESAKCLLEMTKKVLEQNASIMKKQEALEKGAMQEIKIVVDNWLYPNDKIYEHAIKKELEALCPDRMERYKKASRWEALFCKIENLVNSIILILSSASADNLDAIVEEDDKTYLQMVAKRVFGRQPTKNQYARSDNDEENLEDESS